MNAREQAVQYARSLISSDSSPEHIDNICRLSVIKFEPRTTRGEALSADQLKAEIVPSALYGFGEVVRIDENGNEHVDGCECEDCSIEWRRTRVSFRNATGAVVP